MASVSAISHFPCVALLLTSTRVLITFTDRYVRSDNGVSNGATPTCFVSHAWQTNALGLFDAIIKHGNNVVSSGGTPPVYHLDLTDTHHQHQRANNDGADDAEVCFEAPSEDSVEDKIKSCGEMLVVASPFDNTSDFTQRASCMYEMAVAKANNVRITFVLPPSEEARLIDQIQDPEDEGDLPFST
jgi:hypothetical protein